MINAFANTFVKIFIFALVIYCFIPVRADEPSVMTSQFQVHGRIRSLAFTPDGKQIACDLRLMTLDGKSLAEGKADKELPRCTHALASPDGKWLATIHHDGLILATRGLCLWKITGENKLARASILRLTKDTASNNWPSLNNLTFSHDSKLLATREPDGSTIIWDTTTGKERMHLATKGLAVAFSPTGERLITVTRYGLVQHWDLGTKKLVVQPNSTQSTDFLSVEQAVCSEDGTTLAMTDDYSILIKDANDGKTLCRMDNLRPGLLALTPDGKSLAVLGDAGIIIYDRGTGKESAHVAAASRKTTQAMTISPDSKFLVVALEGSSPDSLVTRWEIAKLPKLTKKDIKPVSMPLEAYLTSKRQEYTLELNGDTPDEYANKFLHSTRFPASPEVNFVLTLRNTSAKPVTFDRDIVINLHITGAGALNHNELSQKGIDEGVERKCVTLAPDETFRIPIRTLDLGTGQRASWVLEGEYIIHADCHLLVSSLSREKQTNPKSEFLYIKAPPLQVKVIGQAKFERNWSPNDIPSTPSIHLGSPLRSPLRPTPWLGSGRSIIPLPFAPSNK